MNKLIFVTFLAFLASCQVQKQPPPTNNKDDDDNPIVKILLSNKTHELKHSSHVIVIYEKVVNFQMVGSQKFRSIIYDADIKKKYFLKNDNISKIQVDSLTNVRIVNRLGYILSYYLNDKIELLKSIQSRVNDGGVVTHIYDIDFKSKKTIVYTLDTVMFDEKGSPLTVDDLYDQQFDKKQKKQ